MVSTNPQAPAEDRNGAPLPGRPRVKPEHRPYRTTDGRVRVGGLLYGIAAEVTDPTGAVWTLLAAMDGRHTVGEIVDRVRDRHPDAEPDAIRSAIARFHAAGHLEDAAAEPPGDLTPRECERYDRSRSFFRWVDLRPRASTWEPQLLLRAARVVLVGLGGTGGNAALALTGSGVGRLHCVDGDHVELSNLNRQVLYAEADVGRPKVDVALERLRALNSDVEITGDHAMVTDVDDLRRLAAECDVLLMCADRPDEIRVWANRACLELRRPWVDAGYQGAMITAGAFVPGQGACYECLWQSERERHAVFGATAEHLDAPAAGNAAVAPGAGLSGHLAAHNVLGLITGAPVIPSGHVRGINLVAPDHQFVLNTPARPDCPACQGAAA